MQTISYSEFSKDPLTLLDKAADSTEVFAISLGNDRAVVLLSLREYDSWMETLYLLRSENNRTRLLHSIEEAEKGNVFRHDLIDDEITGS